MYNDNYYIEKGAMKVEDNTKRLNVVISADLHKDLKVEVAKQGMTIGQFVADAIREKIEKENIKE